MAALLSVNPTLNTTRKRRVQNLAEYFNTCENCLSHVFSLSLQAQALPHHHPLTSASLSAPDTEEKQDVFINTFSLHTQTLVTPLKGHCRCITPLKEPH